MRRGTCADVQYTNDGPSHLVKRRHIDYDLVSGYCYRWRLTARDRVGNLGGSVTSGSLLYDDLGPTGDFSSPNEGTFRVRQSTTFTVRWTWRDFGGSGGVSLELERERARAVAGSCSGLFWRQDGPTSSPSGVIRAKNLRPGWCYRWRLALQDGAESMTTDISGVVLIEADGAAAIRREEPI